MDLRVDVSSDDRPLKAFVEEQKLKKEGGNRRALQEISNLVNYRNVPIIKGLDALSLANDHGAAHKKKDKNKVTIKPDHETIIIISSDDEEGENEKFNKKKRNLSGNRSSRKKKVHSLSYVLTARSKMACGLGIKPRDQVKNIDDADADNELAVVEYVEDIYKFYKIIEGENRVSDYMPCQNHINEKMRMILVDWLIEVHSKFKLLPETLYLTVDIVDRYLSRKVVSRKELQLVGISSMLLACKYEEIWAPEVKDFISISDNAYNQEQILVMEKEVLGKLEWNLTVATPYVFLLRFIKATAPADKQMENMAFYLAETGLLHYKTAVSFCPSLIAAAAVCAAVYNLGRSSGWTETLKHYTGYSEEELKECAQLLIKFTVSSNKETKLKGVQRKYSSTTRGAVALMPPSKLFDGQ